jgi:hypothetical protein
MGVIRRNAHERVASAVSYPSPWAVNVRLEDSLDNRMRGGSWAGIATSAVPADVYPYLVTETSDNIVTETGDNITIGTQSSVVGGNGRHWTAPGSDAPSSGTADCVYRDRMLRIDDTNSNAIQASRVGDHADWDLSKDVSDTLRATIFQFSESNEIGGDVVAMVPHKDSSLLAFTAGETWVQQGDPLTGARRNVSRDVGIIAARAWCKHHDTIYFLSSHGLYSVGADGSGLKPLSEDKVPEELTGVSDASCELAYNHADRGVYIHRSTGVSWFYDTARDQFWPFDTSETDSHVLIGPLRIGGPNRYGLVQTIHGIMAAGSSTVVWRIVPGDTAEEACDNGKAAITASLASSDFDEYVAAEGAWDAGRSQTGWPRVRAAWAVLWLSSSSDWAYESVLLEAMPWGRFR